MPRFDPTEFGRLLARLTAQELCKVEGMVTEARERALPSSLRPMALR